MRHYNVGTFTEPVTVYYITGETATTMGGKVQTTASLELMADVKQDSAERLARLGQKIDVESYAFVMRNELPDEAVGVLYLTWDGVRYNPVGPTTDKKSRFLTIRAKR